MERFLDAAPILFGHEHCVASLSGDVNRLMVRGRVINKLIKFCSSLSDRNRIHFASVR